MPIVYANDEERRRGGWLTRAEGRVKTKGLPIGPRSPDLQRILEPDADLSLKAPDDATDPRCAGLAVKIANAQRAVATLRRQYDEAEADRKRAAEKADEHWQKVLGLLTDPRLAELVKNFWGLVRSGKLASRLLGLAGIVAGLDPIMSQVHQGIGLDARHDASVATRDSIGKDRDEAENELARLVAKKVRLRCP
jgi:hypothetical protein